jgi:hypothetical protein
MGVSNMLLFMSIDTPSPRMERTCLALNSFLDTGSGLHINRSFGKAKTHGELAQLRRHGIGHDVMETRQPPYLRMMIETARDSYFVSQGRENHVAGARRPANSPTPRQSEHSARFDLFAFEGSFSLHSGKLLKGTRY